MNESKLVSIIIPVYKAEEYLSNCIQSILDQTYPYWELILINDGSPDGSGAICDDFSSKNSRIHVFHKPNGGVSSARNYGIDKASGEWIMFIDSDDWIDNDTITQCSKYFSKYEMIRFDMMYEFEKGANGIVSGRVKEGWNKDLFLKKLISRQTILGVCGGIFKRELFEKGHIRFEQELIMGEDWLVMFNILLSSKAVYTLSAPFYHYNKFNNQSCVSNYSIKKDKQLLDVTNRILKDERISHTQFNKSKSNCRCAVWYEIYIHAFCAPNKNEYQVLTDEKDSIERPSLRDIFRSTMSTKKKLILVLLSVRFHLFESHTSKI